MQKQQIDYSKWNHVKDDDDEIKNDEALKLKIEWHSKLNMADHQFYVAENSKLTKDYDRAIAGLVIY
jgi:hypothetical protein